MQRFPIIGVQRHLFEMKWWSKKREPKGWTAVEASSEGVLGVSVRSQSTPGGKLEVLKCGVLPEPDLNVSAISQLSKMISVPGFSWTVTLERGNYKLLTLPEPAVKPTEMAKSLRWALSTMIDEPAQDISLDWMSIPTLDYQPQREQQLYAVAMNKNLLQHVVHPFRRAKVNLAAVDIRETGQRNIATLYQRPDEAVGMLAVSSQGVSITFSFQGALYLDRYIEMPLSSMITSGLEGRQKLFDNIATQVRRSVDYVHRTLPFMKVRRIMIAPLPAPIALREYLAGNISEEVEMVDLASVFDFSLTPELASEESQARYFMVLGAALRSAGATV